MQTAQELVHMRWSTYEYMAEQEPARFQPIVRAALKGIGGQPGAEVVPAEVTETWPDT